MNLFHSCYVMLVWYVQNKEVQKKSESTAPGSRWSHTLFSSSVHWCSGTSVQVTLLYDGRCRCNPPTWDRSECFKNTCAVNTLLTSKWYRCICVWCSERTSSARGYYTDECFEEYVDFLLDPARGGIPDDGRWRILVVDGYGSHTCVPSVLRKFQNRHILMITMPSHTSHVLQPLDVSCFKPTKYYFSWCLRRVFLCSKVRGAMQTLSKVGSVQQGFFLSHQTL